MLPGLAREGILAGVDGKTWIQRVVWSLLDREAGKSVLLAREQLALEFAGRKQHKNS